MKNNAEIISKTKQDLIDGFWSLYCEKRIEKITIKELTTKAGYNRSTFYEYFIDIYDVLEQIEASLIPDLDELPPISILHRDNDIPLDMFFKIYEQNEKYYSVLLGDNGDPAFATKLKTSIKPLLRDALFEDVKLDDIELDFVLEYVLSSMISLMSYWFEKDKILPVDKLMFIMKDIMENGLQSIFNK